MNRILLNLAANITLMTIVDKIKLQEIITKNRVLQDPSLILKGAIEKANRKFAKSIKRKSDTMGKMKKIFLGILAGLMFITASAQAGISVMNTNISSMSKQYNQATHNSAYAEANTIFTKTVNRAESMIITSSFRGSWDITYDFSGTNIKGINSIDVSGEDAGFNRPFLQFQNAVFYAVAAGYSSSDIQEMGDSYLQTLSDILDVADIESEGSASLLKKMTVTVAKNYENTVKQMQKSTGTLSAQEIEDRMHGKVKIVQVQRKVKSAKKVKSIVSTPVKISQKAPKTITYTPPSKQAQRTDDKQVYDMYIHISKKLAKEYGASKMLLDDYTGGTFKSHSKYFSEPDMSNHMSGNLAALLFYAQKAGKTYSEMEAIGDDYSTDVLDTASIIGINDADKIHIYYTQARRFNSKYASLIENMANLTGGLVKK